MMRQTASVASTCLAIRTLEETSDHRKASVHSLEPTVLADQ